MHCQQLTWLSFLCLVCYLSGLNQTFFWYYTYSLINYWNKNQGMLILLWICTYICFIDLKHLPIWNFIIWLLALWTSWTSKENGLRVWTLSLTNRLFIYLASGTIKEQLPSLYHHYFIKSRQFEHLPPPNKNVNLKKSLGNIL